MMDRDIPVDYKDGMTPVKELSQWYGKNARKLPWRETSNPYRIWISEVMLQQTQVATVIPYYHRFLETFPTLESLARAEEAQVLARWSGLGYYSRARNLQKGARYIVNELSGVFPKDREGLLRVNGIGPYTAGAIASIAWDLPSPLVDGNVERVFARYFGWTKPIDQLKKAMWNKAELWVGAAKSPRVLNQAIMELGATVCVKGKPQCHRCPLSENCVAFKKGLTEKLPVKKPRRTVEELFWLGLISEARGKYFLRQNQKGEWWADLWDFPRFEFASREAMEAKIAELRGERLQSTKHTVTHHRIHFHPILLKKSELPKIGKWIGRDELPYLPISSLTRKVYELCIAPESHKDKQVKLPI